MGSEDSEVERVGAKYGELDGERGRLVEAGWELLYAFGV